MSMRSDIDEIIRDLAILQVHYAHAPRKSGFWFTIAVLGAVGALSIVAIIVSLSAG